MSESMETEQVPVLSHNSSEFLLWLWWVSDVNGSYYNFSEESSMDSVEIWIDDRLTMRLADEVKTTSVMTGETISSAPEAKVALLNGKVINDMRVGLRREDREYSVTLKGPEMLFHGASLPGVISGGFEGNVYDRMSSLEELESIIKALFNEWARFRVSDTWYSGTMQEIVKWLSESLK